VIGCPGDELVQKPLYGCDHDTPETTKTLRVGTKGTKDLQGTKDATATRTRLGA
jgi:hypothetical protein